MAVTDWAALTAARLLAPLGRRWLHVQAVAERAQQVAEALFDEHDSQVLVAAAWLHDIGYAPQIAHTGFHPLDGARYVRDHGHDRIAALVAHHSGARNEARLRGLGAYTEFPREDTLVATALTFCDMTTGPSGDPVTVAARVDEIVRRYGTGHLVAQAILAGVDELCAAETTIDRLYGERTGRPVA